MTSNILNASDRQVATKNYFGNFPGIITRLRNSIWLVGIPSWLFGIADRTFVSIADGYVSALELVHLFTAFFFFFSWLCLKPAEKTLNSGGLRAIRACLDSNLAQQETYLQAVETRMFELHEQHLISQEYILPFPYFCQIYHLLNLKHLETIHNFSLNNLKVISVNHWQPTEIGGTIKFQTILDSPLNALRIWRQPVVEAALTLHTPYTVELCIPVYNDKHIIVVFHAFPLTDKEHRFCIDIYSNLEWPRPLLQVLLHFASCLTLFEDLPYLEQLAKTNISRLVNFNLMTEHKTDWLFQRFLHLYGSTIETSQPMKALPNASTI